MTIKQDIRTKVIEMAREGKGRNEIAHELSLSGIRISSGSVSNILKECKEGKSNFATEITEQDYQFSMLSLPRNNKQSQH